MLQQSRLRLPPPEKAAEQLMQSATTWMSTAMTIYTIYVVTMVMIQMIWKCEEDEFTMNAQRALNNCTYVGSKIVRLKY